jgi:hypothetical protein
MAPFSPQLKTNPPNAEPFIECLNSYALASCAAGVSLLALASPGEAEIVYTPAHVVIGNNGTYNLDLNNDGITDFTIRQTLTYTSSGRGNILAVEKVPAGNGLVGTVLGININYASALTRGSAISSHKNFIGSVGGEMAGYHTLAHAGGWFVGRWVDQTHRYLGLKFVIDGQTHYGWARLNVSVHGFSIQAVLNGYAYETVPGKMIRTGRTSGTEDNPEFLPESGSSENSVSPKAGSERLSFRRNTLGQLALGDQGLTLWRREEGAS